MSPELIPGMKGFSNGEQLSREADGCSGLEACEVFSEPCKVLKGFERGRSQDGT